MKEVTQHGPVTSTAIQPANDGYMVDALIITFEDGWSLWLSQEVGGPVGVVYGDWFDQDGEWQEVGI